MKNLILPKTTLLGWNQGIQEEEDLPHKLEAVIEAQVAPEEE